MKVKTPKEMVAQIDLDEEARLQKMGPVIREQIEEGTEYIESQIKERIRYGKKWPFDIMLFTSFKMEKESFFPRQYDHFRLTKNDTISIIETIISYYQQNGWCVEYIKRGFIINKYGIRISPIK